MTKTSRWAIFADNVHMGGGRTLLLALLESLPSTFEGWAFLDTRLKLDVSLPEKLSVVWIRPRIADRLRAEFRLRQIAASMDGVLCFGNLPPIFKLKAHTVVFLHNRYMVEHLSASGFPVLARIRIQVERIFLTAFTSHVDSFVVQTPTMERLLQSRMGKRVPVHVMPFAKTCEHHNEDSPMDGSGKSSSAQAFVYIASGEPHKNHKQLVLAWQLLADDGTFPTLFLTISARTWPTLCAWVDDMRLTHSLHIENLGELTSQRVKELYTEVRAVIYPSTAESFGLPLLEARQAGLPILASELDYVRDVVDPVETFDPTSPVSISRAVKRFLGTPKDHLQVMDPGLFFARLQSVAAPTTSDQ